MRVMLSALTLLSRLHHHHRMSIPAQDILTARMLFPAASVFVMIADLSLGTGPPAERLSCFESVYCVKMASRSTHKVMLNWASHHLAWFQTTRMQQLFDPQQPGGCLPTLLFCLHLSSPDFASTFEVVDALRDHPEIGPGGRRDRDQIGLEAPPPEQMQGPAMASSAALAAAPAQLLPTRSHHHTRGSGPSSLSNISSVVDGTSTSPPLLRGAALVRAAGVRVAFVSATIRAEDAALRAFTTVLRLVAHDRVDRTSPARSAAHSTAAEAPPPHLAAPLVPPRHVTLLKAAPDELTSLPWFYSWALHRAVAVIQDETGIPISTLRGDSVGVHAAEPASMPADAQAVGATPSGLSSLGMRAHQHRPGPPPPHEGFAHSGMRVYAFGHYERMQLGRRSWNIPTHREVRSQAALPPSKKSTRTTTSSGMSPLGAPVSGASSNLTLTPSLSLRTLAAGAELPFPWGYAARASDCAATAHRAGFSIASGPCNGVMVIAVRDDAVRGPKS